MSTIQEYFSANHNSRVGGIKIGTCPCGKDTFALLDDVEQHSNKYKVFCTLPIDEDPKHPWSKITLVPSLSKLDGQRKTTKSTLGAYLSAFKASQATIGSENAGMELALVPMDVSTIPESGPGVAASGTMASRGSGPLIELARLPVALYRNESSKLKLDIFNYVHFASEVLVNAVVVTVDINRVWEALRSGETDRIIDSVTTLLERSMGLLPGMSQPLLSVPGRAAMVIGSRMPMLSFAASARHATPSTVRPFHDIPEASVMPESERNRLMEFLARRSAGRGRVLGEVDETSGEDIEMGGL